MKKLTLALLAFMAIGASAEQHRHYIGEHGVIHSSSAGRYETRAVQVVPVRIAPAVVTPTRVLVVPTTTTRTVILDDTADVELLRDRDYNAYDGHGNYNSDLDRMRYDTRYYHYDD